MIIDFKNNASINTVYDNSYLNLPNSNNVYKIDYFIEGLTDDEYYKNFYSLKLFCGNDDIVKINNNVINYFSSNVNPYISYYIKNKNYKKEFYYNPATDSFNTMQRGNLFGKVNLKSCEIDDYTTLQILCYRNSDRQYIGTYKVKSDGTYEIPNLDVNSKYDIILYDSIRRLEQQVQSYRTPTAVTVPSVLPSVPYNLRIDTSSSQPYCLVIKYEINKDVYRDYDYARLIYTGLDGSLNEIVKDRILGKEIYLFYPISLKYGFYRIESVYGNLVSQSSNVIEFKESNNNIIIPDTDYTPPSGDNINIII